MEKTRCEEVVVQIGKIFTDNSVSKICYNVEVKEIKKVTNLVITIRGNHNDDELSGLANFYQKRFGNDAVVSSYKSQATMKVERCVVIDSEMKKTLDVIKKKDPDYNLNNILLDSNGKWNKKFVRIMKESLVSKYDYVIDTIHLTVPCYEEGWDYGDCVVELSIPMLAISQHSLLIGEFIGTALNRKCVMYTYLGR